MRAPRIGVASNAASKGGGGTSVCYCRHFQQRTTHSMAVTLLRLSFFLFLSPLSRQAPATWMDGGMMTTRRQQWPGFRERELALDFRLNEGFIRLRGVDAEDVEDEDNTSGFRESSCDRKTQAQVTSLSTCRREFGPARSPLPSHPPLCLRGGSGLPPGGQVVQCTYTNNWDTNGVLYFLGRMAANAAANSGQLPPGSNIDWLNPAMAGFVRVHCGEEGYNGYDSERFDIVLEKELVIDRKEVPGAAFFGDGWFIVELGPNFQLRPTHYTLRNGGGTGVACMTGWVLEGSQGVEGPWHTLDHRGCSENRLPMEEHQCCVFNELAKQCEDTDWPHDSVTFPIAEGSQVLIGGELCPTPGHNNCGFRVFRLRQLLNRMPGSTNMYIQGLELYGDLYIPPM